MTEYKKRGPASFAIARFFALMVGTVALFLVSVVAVRAAWSMYDTFKVAADARLSAENQLSLLRADEKRVSAAVASFDTPQGVEREIRERFGVVKPGEGQIQIIREEFKTPLVPNRPNFFEQILDSFIVW
ncbi:MAG TPA: hypothetical protein VD928_02365 [Candidatus Paceibacterota bacterium]|nr:hypothetical protein [Candidatus Paceibacterota bacterium]